MGDGENSKTLLWHVFQVLGQDGVVICPVCRFIIVDFRGPIGMCFSSVGEGARAIGHMTSAVNSRAGRGGVTDEHSCARLWASSEFRCGFRPRTPVAPLSIKALSSSQ